MAGSGGTKPRCYLASPLGFTDGGRWYLTQVYLPALATVVDPVDPWSFVSPPDPPWTREYALDLGRRNRQAIDSCSLLVAYLEGQEPDAGTVAELGYAVGLGMRAFGLRSDLRETGEPLVAVNLQVESFIIDSGGTIRRSLEELVATLNVTVNDEVPGQGPGSAGAGGRKPASGGA